MGPAAWSLAGRGTIAAGRLQRKPGSATCHHQWLPMPLLDRPDDTQIYWDETGEGPRVLVANSLQGHPGMLEGLVRDLAADHRVVTYDLRGTGGSSRKGPYDPAVDVEDLEALLEHVGGVTVAVAIADAGLRAVRIAAARPDLLDVVVAPGTAVLTAATRGSDALTGSRSVLKAILTLVENDYRAAMRTIVESANPDLTEEGVRERVDRVVEHCSHESVVKRLRAWMRDDATDAARALGNRLWVLAHPGNPWFPPELAERMPELLPEARHDTVADGPVSRPDLTAAVVRQITRPERAGRLEGREGARRVSSG
jgi:pimeloyl-ACP methyl ester carboxylesterase